MRFRSVMPAALVAVALARAAAAAEPGAQADLFLYDAGADLKVEEVGVDKRAGVSVRDIRFTPIAGRDPVAAYLVEPEGKGPFAGILWVHWLGEPATTNRTQFREEAAALAPRGVVSLPADAMWDATNEYATVFAYQDDIH